jgi:two-component system cell cycle response regulator
MEEGDHQTMKSREGPINESIRVLIVEDSPTQAEQLRYMLERNGYQPSVTSNGVEALSFLKEHNLKEHNPTLVISDILMPEMGGFELCRQIKEDENLKGLPVILLTSLSDPLEAVKGLECGADNFITKPYSQEFLLSRLKHVLINREFRKDAVPNKGVEIFFAGEKHLIHSNRVQILELLLSVYENAAQKSQELEVVNRELRKTQVELKALNEHLEEMVEKRTVELKKINEQRNDEIIVRKKTEEELEKHKANLEQIVRERTTELQKMVNLMAGREVRMADLKKTIKKLRAQLEEAGLTPVADDPLKEV